VSRARPWRVHQEPFRVVQQQGLELLDHVLNEPWIHELISIQFHGREPRTRKFRHRNRLGSAAHHARCPNKVHERIMDLNMPFRHGSGHLAGKQHAWHGEQCPRALDEFRHLGRLVTRQGIGALQFQLLEQVRILEKPLEHLVLNSCCEENVPHRHRQTYPIHPGDEIEDHF